jgi:DNA-binding LacI/PurR family transcriptional regulator/signal transduction histidine kinase
VLSGLPPPTRSGRPQGARRTIAVLFDYLDHLGSGYDTQLCSGFEAACEIYDCNLIFAVGRPLFSADPISAVHNEVYRLVHPSNVDGLVLIAAGLSSACGPDSLRRLCEEFASIALCSLGVQIPNVPSIVIDNQLGMQAVVEHIINDHGCRRVAFLGGPQNNTDAAARLQVYKQVLAQNGLPFDEHLTAFAEFTSPSGMAATNRLVDSGVEFDALVASNDGMALGAMEALRKHGRRVPRDVLVAGFDDLPSARFSNPPLTTARQPLERMASLAIERIVAQWQGHEVPTSTRQPVELVKRRSCGCHHAHRDTLWPRVAAQSDSVSQYIEQNFDRLRLALNACLNESGYGRNGDSGTLLVALQGDINGQADAFLAALDDFLVCGGVLGDRFDAVQAAVGVLRDEFVSIGAVQFEELWDGARRTIALSNSRCQSEQRSALELTYQRLLSCSERFSGVAELAAFRQVLSEELPKIPINNAFLALSVGGLSTELEPLLNLSGGRMTPLSGPIAVPKLLSVAAAEWNQRRTAFLLPLTFECQYLGVALIEPHLGFGVCAMLREQISHAVKNIALHQEIEKKTALHELSVKERIATAAHMESLRVMAGGVAHDLNSALSPIVALPDVILGLLKKLGVDQGDEGQRLRYYLETIGSAANRATQTIRDLMTLGRQGRTQKSPLDLNWIVASCMSGEPELSRGDNQPEIHIAVDLHPTSLIVNASQHHVERAISNLVRNAVEAIGDGGEISVTTGLLIVDEPIAGYDSAIPGTYAKVTVSDTGPGIPAEMIARVFEPFFTSKKLGDKSGSGLGLSIVHEVVKEHNGFIDLVSEAGQGTKFTLYFPIATQSASYSRNSESAQSPQTLRSGTRDTDAMAKEVHSAVHDRLEATEECTTGLPTCQVGG